MSNIEDFEKLITAMDKAPVPMPSEALQNVYLGCIARYLAEIADVLNEIKDARNVAVETMRKYQKIEQIVNIWSSDTGKDNLSGEYYLRDIRGVLENGNDDCR